MKFKLAGWTVAVLQKTFKMENLNLLHHKLRALPENSTGKVVSDMLDRYNFRLIPKFPNHDLKHVILDYEMNINDEIRMQAYLVGNGNYTLPCLLFLSLGILKPKLWNELIKHFRQGKESNSIFELKLEEVMHIPLMEVKAKFERKISTNKTY